MNKNVLILVLLENALREVDKFNDGKQIKLVLILVLLENALRVLHLKKV